MSENTVSPATPESPTAVGVVVERLMYASLSCVSSPIFAELARIREHALRRNVADQVHVALLYQSGWFTEWLEGPPEGVRAVMARVARDARHKGLKLLHVSHGPRRLTEPWSMAVVQTAEKATDFGRRVMAEREAHQQGRGADPATVWRRLSTPLSHPGATEQAATDRFQRVMVCAAEGSGSFELVRWLGQHYEAEVVHRRFAGSREDGLDVGTDYVDMESGAVVRRVIAMARHGLQLGLTQAFMPDYSHILLLLSGDPVSDGNLLRRVVGACDRLPQRPMLVGVGPQGMDHAPLDTQARAGGLFYMGCALQEDPAPAAWWAAAEPLLNRSPAANSDWEQSAVG